MLRELLRHAQGAISDHSGNRKKGDLKCSSRMLGRPITKNPRRGRGFFVYSHSIVAGGFDEIS
jgi:hypothetical protein